MNTWKREDDDKPLSGYQHSTPYASRNICFGHGNHA
uniref:Uncharacterized protein n=1 Tax=Rhizophora mucronata TaxID=61149 RepID=A0A2P2MZR1_RHIMU